MSTPMYIIVGRLRASGEAVLHTAYSPIAYKYEIAAMTEYRAVIWGERESLFHALKTLPWLNPSERLNLARKLQQTINFF